MPSDAEETGGDQDKPFVVERAKSGRAKCKKCKCTIEKDELRMGKLVVSFFSEGKLMPAWHHVTCLFEVFAKQRATTKRIDDPEEDVKGWEQLSDEDKQIILEKLEELEKSCNYSHQARLSIDTLRETSCRPPLFAFAENQLSHLGNSSSSSSSRALCSRYYFENSPAICS